MILGLAGPRGGGKDTLADYLVEDYSFKRIAFADPIREQVKFLLQLKSDYEYDIVKRSNLLMLNHPGREHLIDGRHLVREIGMLMLSYGKDQFTNYVTTEITKNIEKYNYVVTDLRMDHEYVCLKRLDAFIVKIKTGKPNTDKHVTEVGFDDSQCDYIIDNSTRDLDQFRKNIDTMIQGRFNVYPSSR